MRHTNRSFQCLFVEPRDVSGADVLSAHGTLNGFEHRADAPPQMESVPQLFLSADRVYIRWIFLHILRFVGHPHLQQ